MEMSLACKTKVLTAKATSEHSNYTHLNSVAETLIPRHVRFFDKETFDFVGQKAMLPVNEKYLRKIFGFADDDPMLFSYPVSQKQKMMIERLAGIKINFDKYEYFIDCDFGNTGSSRVAG